MSAPSITDNVLANQLGTNDNQRFSAIIMDVEVSEDKGCFLEILLREYETAERQKLVRQGEVEVGFGFQNGFTVAKSAFKPMIGLALAYAVFDLYYAVGEIKIELGVTTADKAFIEETLTAIASWNVELAGLKPADLLWDNAYSEASWNSVKHELDYNRVVLGASGGKESSLNRIILEKAGYAIENVTFTKSHHENEPNSSLYLHWIPDEDASYIMIPGLNPLPGKAFDAQGALGVPLYGLLAFVAAQKGAGLLAVGTEFGMSKVWYPTDPTSNVKREVHDLSVDEGLYTCQQLEKYLAAYGMNMHIISPVGPLHELGILRALHEQGFDLRMLDSCWLAKNLNTHYCGQCYKCQRIKQYMDMLHSRYPRDGYDRICDFENLHIATGAMLSYSVQYHLTEEHPNLPWDFAIIADETSLRFLDYRTGNRIIKVLVEQLGFSATIYPGLYDQEFKPKVLSSHEFIERVKKHLQVDYSILSVSYPRLRDDVWFWMPYEEAVIGQIAFSGYHVPEGWVPAPAMSRFHRVPVYVKETGKWHWFRFTPTAETAGTLDLVLGKATRDLKIMQLWQGYETIMAGITFLNVPHVGLEEEIND